MATLRGELDNAWIDTNPFCSDELYKNYGVSTDPNCGIIRCLLLLFIAAALESVMAIGTVVRPVFCFVTILVIGPRDNPRHIFQFLCSEIPNENAFDITD
jgi:hypothetical protein